MAPSVTWRDAGREIGLVIRVAHVGAVLIAKPDRRKVRSEHRYLPILPGFPASELRNVGRYTAPDVARDAKPVARSCWSSNGAPAERSYVAEGVVRSGSSVIAKAVARAMRGFRASR